MQWIKHNKSDKVWWEFNDRPGEFIFSFDKKTIYNLFRDYPENLNAEEKTIFDAENPYWADFFKNRT